MNARTEKIKKILVWIFLYAVIFFLYLPIMWLVVFSFTDTHSISEWNGFSFQAYIDLFAGENSGDIFQALVNTLIIAISASAIATILGTLAAIGLHHMRNKKFKKIYGNVSQVPMINSEIITAVSLMLLFTFLRTTIKVGGNTQIFAVILAHTTFCAPYVVLNVLPRLNRMDNSLYEAALDLGAKPSQALFKVIIPELMPGIIMGFIMSITLSIDDFVITKFTIQGFNTLSTYIYSMSSGKKPLPIEIRALSSIMFLIILALLVFVNVKNGKAKAKGGKK